MVSLPNIVSGEKIVPEIIENQVTVDNITYSIEKFLYDRDYRENNIKKLKQVKHLLSDKTSSKEAANEILKALQS